MNVTCKIPPILNSETEIHLKQSDFQSPGDARCPLACTSVPSPLLFVFFYKVGVLGMGTQTLLIQ